MDLRYKDEGIKYWSLLWMGVALLVWNFSCIGGCEVGGFGV